MSSSTSCALPVIRYGRRHRRLPHPTDLAISKLVAWRENDRDFVRALVRHRIVNVSDLDSRLDEIDAAVAERIRPRIRMLESSDA